GRGGEALDVREPASGDELVADRRDASPLSGEQLVRPRVRARRVDEDAVGEIEQARHLLAADEELGLPRPVGRNRVEVDVAAVLDRERDAVSIPDRLAREREGSAL